ncbi:hypothetical protein PVAP13_8KG352200 [Panicum virgatum]|uniref:Uncharacterized protein n=1 Tax=Panicum virgatum TaxID=38727 RepID=A0A8T0PPF2_PANVG|nr:hypothetical protein PVAP13_8KG352200 [Panicum virgatum]
MTSISKAMNEVITLPIPHSPVCPTKNRGAAAATLSGGGGSPETWTVAAATCLCFEPTTPEGLLAAAAGPGRGEDCLAAVPACKLHRSVELAVARHHRPAATMSQSDARPTPPNSTGRGEDCLAAVPACKLHRSVELAVARHHRPAATMSQSDARPIPPNSTGKCF